MANEIFDVVDGTRTRTAAATNENAALTKVWIKDNANALGDHRVGYGGRTSSECTSV